MKSYRERRAELEQRARTIIFQEPITKLKRYELMVDVLQELEELGRFEGAKAKMTEPVGDDCACRCLVHGRSACPRCLDVRRCPVHG